MKFRWWLIFILCVVVVSIVSYQNDAVLPFERHTPDESPPLSPYSIAHYSQREYVASTITIERFVRETSTFRSYVVSYLSDNLKQYALMNVPTTPMPDEGFPIVVVNHGYIDPDIYSTENSYINTSAFFAQNGFLVLKPDYRDHDKSEGEARKFVSRIEYAVDVAHLLASVATIPEANPRKIFMYGHSMGGDITLRLMEMSAPITASSLWAPAVTDFPESHLYFMRRNSPGELLKDVQELEGTITPAEYDSISVMKNLHLISAPLIIHHGTDDESVPYAWGEALYQSLQNAHKTVTFYSYQGDNHDIAGNWSTALSRDVAFFRSFLTN